MERAQTSLYAPLQRSSYILAYNSHHLKDTFNVHSLDLKAVARSFGFSTPPRVNINIESKAAHTRKAQKTAGGADYRRMKTGTLGWECACKLECTSPELEGRVNVAALGVAL